MLTHPPPLRHQPTRFALTALLVITLLLASFLGVVHRIAHASLEGRASLVASADDGWSKRLFDAHRDAGSCTLYDQLMQGAGAPAAPAVAVAAGAPERLAIAHDASVDAVLRDAVRARGPPKRG